MLVNNKTSFMGRSGRLMCLKFYKQAIIVNWLICEQDLRICQGALSAARSAQFNSMVVVFLDASGQWMTFVSEDGARMFRFDIARAKAWGAVGMGSSSHAWAERAKDNTEFFVALTAQAEGKFLTQPGAVLIKDASGQILGAAGASGSIGDEDEQICAYGIQAVGLFAGSTASSDPGLVKCRPILEIRAEALRGVTPRRCHWDH